MIHPTHKSHRHQHASACGHTAIRHRDHTDYLHSGHLHCPHGSHVDEHQIEISEANPDRCLPVVTCSGVHTRDGSETIPHGDHVDSLVRGRLHHLHEGHCDDHGPVDLA